MLKTESVAKILIINATKQALVLTLGEHLQSPEKSFSPDLPGGIVESGESELVAAVRETSEECGIDLDAKDVRLVYAATEHYPKESKSVSKLLYISHVGGVPEVTLSWEHSDYKWMPLDELRRSVTFRPFYQAAIEYCFDNELC